MAAADARRPLTAALYARVSTEDQARHGYSLGEQLARCRARAVALGAERVAEYVDEGVSGELWDRPALSALRAEARSGRVGLFVCLDPDRLARRLVHQLLATEELERSGVRIEFVDFEWRATPEGQLFAQLRGAIAEYEKAKIKARTMLGRHAKAARGLLPHYTRPYGYRWQDGGLVVAPAEADGVRAAFAWFLGDPDLGYRALARRMQAAFPPRRGRWDGTAMRRILTNPAYAGALRVERYDAQGAHLNRHLPRQERVPYRRPRPPGSGLDAAVPAIVEPEIWQAARAKAERIRGQRRGSPGRYLLSGLVRCARCGAAMAGKTQRAGGHIYRYYACRRGCGAPQVRAGDLEAAVWDAVAARALDPEALVQALAEPGERPPEPVAAALAALREEEERVWGAWRRGLVAPERFEAAVREMARRREHLARLGEREVDTLGAVGLDAAAVAAALPELDWATRRKVLAELVEGVDILADGWRLRLRV